MSDDEQNSLVCSIPGCGAKLRKSNTIGRCQEHRYTVERAVCAVDGCGEPLRKDNATGYCKRHKFATDRAPVRICAADGCDRSLRADNQSGYCKAHAQQTAAVRAYRDRQYAELREQSEQRRQQRPLCSVDGCTNRLRSDNTSGRCTDHIYIPLDLAVCSVDGCENRLTSRNTTGRCMDHRNWHADEAPKCGDPSCGRTLHRDNQTGFCHKHRKQWRATYNQSYYRRNRGALVEYARRYREEHPEEHREASRHWERANPLRKLANDAAFRARNRERLRVSNKAASRKHYAAYKERRRAQGRDYYARNPEKRRAATARWRSMHPEFSSARNARRRARIRLPREDRRISLEYRAAIRNDPCFYCGGIAEHTDHYFPLVKGGTDHWFNLVRACQDCNLSKHARCGTAFLLLTGG
jgi:hypothetical protein